MRRWEKKTRLTFCRDQENRRQFQERGGRCKAISNLKRFRKNRKKTWLRRDLFYISIVQYVWPTCNLNFLVTITKETHKVKFKNIFYLTQYIKNIIVKHVINIKFIFYYLDFVLSLKSCKYFTPTAPLNSNGPLFKCPVAPLAHGCWVGCHGFRQQWRSVGREVSLEARF